jgi:ribosomal protein L3 glutamine methyltransferase
MPLNIYSTIMPARTPITPRQLINWATQQFEAADLHYGHGTDNAHDEAVFMVLRTLGLPFAVDEDRLDRNISEEQKKLIVSRIQDRIRTRKPAAYILNEAWFAGLPFYVNESVLVPRSPFAELILEKFSPWCDAAKVHAILDIGTGSGCIAIASALAFPEAQIDATDISTEALAVARRNVELHAVHNRVTLIQSDLFEQITDRKYDLIIANPPYVDAEDMAALPAEYQHEPISGLRAGQDGLDVVRRILHTAGQHLTENGVIAVEVGNSQAALIKQYPEVPFLWLEFARGGEGVFLLTRDEVLRGFG